VVRRVGAERRRWVRELARTPRQGPRRRHGLLWGLQTNCIIMV
jgi:hypothetical protein